MPIRDIIDLRERAQDLEKIQKIFGFFDLFSEPRAVKSIDSKFLYANFSYKALFGLPDSFDIVGKSEEDLAFATRRFSDDVKKHERIVIAEKKTKCSLMICEFGEEKKIKAYLFEKSPFLDDRQQIIGTYFEARPVKYLPRSK